MHTHDLSQWQHAHEFDQGNPAGEKNTRRVLVLTAIMMVTEITAGKLLNSMALLADGWHMATHVTALGLSALAYLLARRYAADPRFAFGTWRMEVLGSFASAIVLAMVALYMAVESVQRFFEPLTIDYRQALVVAVIGLAVNLLSALLLKGHDHGHHHDDHHHDHADLNLRSAYIHVIADATTSVLAIGALLGGMFCQWAWLDPLMGIVGSGVISVWALGLLRQTSRVLLDREMDHEVVGEVREALEADGDTQLSDLHVWRVGKVRFACVVAVVSANPQPPDYYKELLSVHEELTHITVEVHRCVHAESMTG